MSLPNGFLLLAPFALFLTASLRLRSKTAYLLSLYLCAYASIVLLGEAAGLLQALRGQFFIAGHFLLGGAAYAIWRRCGRPPLLGPFRGFKLSAAQVKGALRAHAGLALFAAAVLAAWGVNAWLIVQVPPNNYDGMTYHLARVGYWLQHASLAPWATPNLRQVNSPPNAELGLLWTLLFSGSDAWAGFVQWSAGWAGAAAIFGMARLLNATRPQALFAALAWATLPAVVLQSTSVQNDLLAAALCVVAVYFLCSGLLKDRHSDLMLSGLALALALGVKITAAFLVPGLALALLLALWAARGRNFKPLLTWGLAALLSFGLFGSFIYVQNQAVYGGLTGYEGFSGDPEVGRSRRILLTANPFLYLYQAIDPTGLPSAAVSRIIQAKSSLLPPLFNALGIPISTALSYTPYLPVTVFSMEPGVHEDSAWFGLHGLLLLGAASLYQGWRGLRARDLYRFTLLLPAASFLLIVCLALEWTPYRGRYFIVPVTLLAPLCAFFYERRLPARIFTTFTALLGLWVLGWCLLFNNSKPLVGPRAIATLDEVARRSLTNPEVEPALRMVAAQVPPKAGLGLMLGSNGWDFPFWGAVPGRKLVQVEPPALVSQPGWLESQGLDYLLVGPRQKKFLIVPAGLQLVAHSGCWQLFARANPAAITPTRAEQLRAAAKDPTGLVTVAAGLVGQVGVIETWTGAWAIENDGQHGILWLGEGEPQAIGLSVWSEAAQDVRLVLDAGAGPGRVDSRRTLALVILDEHERRTTLLQSFEGAGQIEFTLPLRAGYNSFGIHARDQATIRTQPNGDNRPLLVLLRNITLKP